MGCVIFIIQPETQIAIRNPNTFTTPSHMNHFTFQRQHFFECFTCLWCFLFQKIGDETVTLVEYGKRLDMTRALFDNDSIPLNYPNSKAISLRSKNGGSYVRLEYPVSDCITVWSPTGDDRAEFVCLEPWTSVPTFYDDDFEALENKPNAIRLEKGERYRYYYDIKLF